MIIAITTIIIMMMMMMMIILMMMMLMLMLMMLLLMMMITLKGANREREKKKIYIYSSHYAANCLRCARSLGQGAILHKSRILVSHRSLIMHISWATRTWLLILRDLAYNRIFIFVCLFVGLYLFVCLFVGLYLFVCLGGFVSFRTP